jgi:hypothetical protein
MMSPLRHQKGTQSEKERVESAVQIEEGKYNSIGKPSHSPAHFYLEGRSRAKYAGTGHLDLLRKGEGEVPTLIS